MYDKYIGIPYLENGRTEEGIDCWGLARLFYKQEFNIELPSYDTEYIGSYDPKVSQAINYYKDNWVRTNTPKLGDLCLFNILGEPTHVGVYLENSKFLHAREGHSSVIESLKKHAWNRRLEGIYNYSPYSNIVQLTGVPHPFKTNRILDFAIAGQTVKQCVEYIREKYKISEQLVKQIVVAIDGVAISKDNWATTILRAGQLITYKTIPQGRNALRTLLIIAVVIFVPELITSYLPAGTASWAVAAAKFAATAAAIALVNAIVPIRPPSTENPASSNPLNLFNGTNNRTNPYGAIPVVLGRVRITPFLGSQPYIDTQTTTSYMNMQLVWGFGPLELDINELYIGANKLDYYYQSNNADAVPRPVTVMGYVDSNGLESETQKITEFNKLYPNIIEQQFKNVELENDSSGNNEEVITFTETQATRVQAIISFPEGLRKINTKDGKSYPSPVSFQIQLERVNGGVTQVVNTWKTEETFYDTITPSLVTEYDSYTGFPTNYDLYQKTAYCLTEKSGIVAIRGSVSETKNSNPSYEIKELLNRNQLSNLLNIENNYSFEPIIPPGYKVLYTVINYKTSPLEIDNIINDTYTYSGWTITPTQELVTGYFSEQEGNSNFVNTPTGKWTITIGPGTLGPASSSPAPGSATQLSPLTGGILPSTITVWTTRQFTNAVPTTNNSVWGTFMNQNSVWLGTSQTFDQQMTVNFPYDGIYTIQASIDNNGGEIIIGDVIIKIPDNSYRDTGFAAGYKSTQFFNAGNKTVRVKGNNKEPLTTLDSDNANAGVAVKITFVPDNIVNFVPGANYITIGDNEFSTYKDGFSYPITWDNLIPGQYRIKIRRTTTSDPDHEADMRHSFKSQFLSATAFKSGTSIKPPLGIGLCRTAIVLESSGKINGSVDGVNAVVQTRGWDYVIKPGTSEKHWLPDQLIDNPASLFVYVLTHPANAYAVSNTSLDVPAITAWHVYCDTPVTGVRPRLTYNGVITSTTSVLSILQDICAAGMASPVFVDGKWSVIIDQPRAHVIQHFTPHNSWGFEATKTLPKLPDAFRISFPDERNSFQTQEILVANFGKNTENAKIIEELNLPGITKVEQARYFARWHFAQLQYRPEIFTINTDFEYLVCTRGDRVKITHDIPLWGVGSGRIKAISTDKLTITLTENIALQAGTSYQIRIRTDNITASGGGSLERNLATIANTGMYDTILLSSAVDSTVKVDDLFMLGELNKITEDLLVQSIEPTSNTSAKLTLVEYTESLYNFPFDPFNDVTPELPSYVPQITKRIGSQIVQNSIVSAPIILSIETADKLSEEISTGIYENVAIITWQNAINLPISAEKVELQIILGNEIFNETKQSGLYLVNKDTTSYTVKGLTKDIVYKVRARYRNAAGTISGPWSEEYSTTNIGKSLNLFKPEDLSITFQDTFVYVKPVLAENTIEPTDFDTYEFRIYKYTESTDPGDFWDINVINNTNILVAKSKTQAVFNLLDFKPSQENKVISASGVNYKIACRAINNSKNYSYESALGGILIQTIQ
jgi:hypothetical protein